MNKEAVIKDHVQMISRIAASYERDESLRQDLIQDMMMGLLVALPKYKGQGALKAYVARVSQNIALTYLRKTVPHNQRQIELDVDIADGSQNIESQLSVAQEQEKLRDAVAQLPLNLKQVIILALEGLTYREIAEAIDISENNVAVRFNRAKEKLKEMMKAVS